MPPEAARKNGAAPPSDVLRLVLCTPRYLPQIGGAETWLRGIASRLAERGHEVTVLALAATGVAVGEQLDGVEVARVAGRLALGREVVRRARVGLDAVVAQFSAVPFAVAAARRAGIATVAVVHDVYGLSESIRIKGALAGAARYAVLEQSLRLLSPDAYLVPSRTTAERLRPLARGRPVTVVPPGTDHLPQAPASTQDPRRLVFVGRLVQQKGVDDLLAALRLLHARGRVCRATIVGEGPEAARLRATTRDLGGAVHFTGILGEEALDAAVRSSLALVLPSTREGWGLVLTEAAARSVPYVAYDLPAVREQHELLQGGLLVSPGPEPLAAAIQELLDDPSRAAELGRRGRAAAESLTWARAAEIVEAELTDTCRRVSRRRPS